MAVDLSCSKHRWGSSGSHAVAQSECYWPTGMALRVYSKAFSLMAYGICSTAQQQR